MFDVRRLALLRELSLRGTVAATAEAMHMSGPGVSQQLAVLEREAGVALLEKHGRRLVLTTAGQLLVTHTDVVLGNLAAAESELAELREGGGGTVRIAAFPSAARALVTRLWHQPAADGPAARVDLRLYEQEPELSVDALMRREVDVAVIHAYSLLPRDLPDCEREALLEDPVLLALHPDDAAAHDLRSGDPARLEDFAAAPWLIPGPDTSCHEMIRRACGAAGFVMHVTAQATDFSVLTALVAAGAGAALIPRMALAEPTATGTDRDGQSGDRGGGVSLHPLADSVTRSISALTRSGESNHPLIRRVLDDLHTARTDYEAGLPTPR